MSAIRSATSISHPIPYFLCLDVFSSRYLLSLKPSNDEAVTQWLHYDEIPTAIHSTLLEELEEFSFRKRDTWWNVVKELFASAKTPESRKLSYPLLFPWVFQFPAVIGSDNSIFPLRRLPNELPVPSSSLGLLEKTICSSILSSFVPSESLVTFPLIDQVRVTLMRLVIGGWWTAVVAWCNRAWQAVISGSGSNSVIIVVLLTLLPPLGIAQHCLALAPTINIRPSGALSLIPWLLEMLRLIPKSPIPRVFDGLHEMASPLNRVHCHSLWSSQICKALEMTTICYIWFKFCDRISTTICSFMFALDSSIDALPFPSHVSDELMLSSAMTGGSRIVQATHEELKVSVDPMLEARHQSQPPDQSR
ncbi:uncharacterized protein BDR25DRAFT_353448 [Lindgomyces ingoldianus]|uniref:Uncharacterized protein n=1 Tax=Lindgomyces ingoldianus TaxID=673940 RepID=A0ACB6R0S3_9PLEO|nr:uncharacterized protein BDR25DRAFT_353448 [Lindgomyces ingoldianus]KAF2472418.1 hypothetical protein BDR25DRAFT_353448 [Lindgomyces ingoldianus]